VFDEDQLREMSHGERLELMRALAALDNPEPDDDPVSSRRRVIALVVIVLCCAALAAWIGVLAVTLPRYYRSGEWRGAWVGFDLALLAAFAVTGWAAWRRRQLLIVCLIVLATLLCCDAWFDVVLDAHTKGFWVSLLSALFIELPLAALAIYGARHLLHLSMRVVRRYEGQPGRAPSLRRGPIIGGSPGSPLSDLFKEGSPAGVAAGGSAAGNGSGAGNGTGPGAGPDSEGRSRAPDRPD
jgi:hypothetical protein